MKYLLIIWTVFTFSCQSNQDKLTTLVNYKPRLKDTSFFGKLADSSISLTFQKVTYDPSYFDINYPNGDVPANKGVCSDVIIRAYRKLGIDLQSKVHEDMSAYFNQYPKKWGLSSTDKNIDHRRVPNLMTFFKRNNAELSITDNELDYKPGDIVCWLLPKDLTHIGIVIDSTADMGNRNLIVHNIGSGQVVADCLFSFKIIGHYRFKD